MPPMFVISGTGTRGDQFPMLAIAEEMQRRGHECHVLGTDALEDLAEECGVPFTSIGPTHTNNLTSVEQNFGNHVFPSYQPTFDFIEAEVLRGRDLVIVNLENYVGSTLMAERHGLPLCRLLLAPFRLRSLVAPHWPWSERAQGRMGATFRRYVLPKLYHRRESHPYIMARMNGFRAALGLARIDSLRALEAYVTHHVCLFPEWFCPKPPDWPASLDCAGFPLRRTKVVLCPEVRQWLENRSPPLVFTPGTGVLDVHHFFEHARRCCDVLGRPGLFLSPNLDSSRLEPHPDILHLDYLDLELVLPFAALLVHHGGIGTTARAFEAGVPQIVSPQSFDQPDNAHRVSQLGAGFAIDRAELSGETMAEAARALLQSDDTRRVVADLRRRMETTNAVAYIADILESRFDGVAPVVSRNSAALGPKDLHPQCSPDHSPSQPVLRARTG